ncbi:hypothetical protein BSF38_03018 [Paludisphaera borealis]|uniref:Uncharacterized protein n=1 Tax=Paludisphaera borealis TaxID=1387353 RepID=A0A1U7CRJ8_9BACT|nr:hypothetical protein BSF38_03018 [Paludisphaera borealis]
MLRTANWIILIAALAGTPLRQAEAADDLCRSMIEQFEPANLETPDGGVGDDSGVGTLAGTHASVIADPFSSAAPFIPTPASAARSITVGEAEALRERVWWPPHPPNVRHAWLQIFLF